MRRISYLYFIVFIAGTSLPAVSLAELTGQNKELTSFTSTLAADLKELLNRKNVQRAGIIAGALCLIVLAVICTRYFTRYLVQANPAANEALLEAAVDGSLKRAGSALLKGAQVNVRDSWGKTPLSWAVGSEKKDLIQKLLDEGANPYQQDNFGNDALTYASNDIKDLILHHPKVLGSTPAQ